AAIPTAPAPASPAPTAAAPAAAAPAAPVVETPEPTAGRLVRLRARLSRSQGLLGKGLLALLSRDHIDDETWEDLEDTLIGADVTFRAAATEQLSTWASRVGAEVVRGKEGSDPAAVAYDAVKRGIDTDVDTVVIDTAGRLQNKVGLMDELGKVKRVVEKHGPIDETLLILDATTGQNGLEQARVFTEVCDVTGVVLTKLDGTAKGGIVIAVQRRLGIPVKLVGLGEGPDDLAPFDPGQFVDALLGSDA